MKGFKVLQAQEVELLRMNGQQVGVQLERKFMSCSQCQELGQLAVLASDWLFTTYVANRGGLLGGGQKGSFPPRILPPLPPWNFAPSLNFGVAFPSEFCPSPLKLMSEGGQNFSRYAQTMHLH